MEHDAEQAKTLSRAAVASARSIMIMEGQINAPRVWRAGDPEPDGVPVVLDSNGSIWQRGYTPGWICEDAWTDWPTMLRVEGPLVEVILPAPVTE